MQLPTLQSAKLLRRYKRFLADVQLPDGSTLTLHCPNTGAMTGCADEGDTVWFSTSTNTKRKYAHTWELTEKPNGNIICVNTTRANALVHEALQSAVLPELANYQQIQSEVKYGQENSRIDFLLQDQKQPDAYVEVKSVTLLGETQSAVNLPAGCGLFPDAVTTRGQKHLRELMHIHQCGARAAIVYAALHSGIHCFYAQQTIDKKYADLLYNAHKTGVEVYCLQAVFTRDNSMPTQLTLQHKLPIIW
ncbi:DNA/RNA nuclease SfsA [Pasteurellaceae bacterium HPA106]|uniref:DNA/RNA nuclease SfsA n=1 Tax=Spirabiliibacterium pneumoniae TaxID=221400 RepID=UPI001AACDF01|nr:DNA/RNA nuclease SfsA [Spirabiliibacterium pneumoniae]MBE2895630.1 DNA/RNA nuclease SfsA [Spirabiliibacterium pneumoniae]